MSWGDVSQALIYHQVRKYLLRLENVQLKYWRPQILLLTVNPRTSFEALRFANDMKKGGLYIVGRVLVGEMNRTTAKRQADLQKAWNEMGKYVKIKTFADIVISDTVRKGVQSLLATSGLGGMRPVPNQQLLSRACAFCRPLLRFLPWSRERWIERRHRWTACPHKCENVTGFKLLSSLERALTCVYCCWAGVHLTGLTFA